jgi:hypothetical protein
VLFQAVLLSPGRLAMRVPISGPLRLLTESYLLLSFLHACFSRGMDEASALRLAVGPLKLRNAAGTGACERLESGEGFLAVMADMPALRALEAGVPHLKDIPSCMATLALQARERLGIRMKRVEVSLHSAGLAYSGGLILLVALNVFLTLYSGDWL